MMFIVMTKAAFAIWKNRIAPVFDVTRAVHLVETREGLIVHQKESSIAAEIPNQKVGRLAELEVNTLICGAISKSLQAMLTAYGIEVIPFVSGDLDEVIQAWLNNELTDSSVFAMPGCRNAGRHRFSKNTIVKQRDDVMERNTRSNRGGGQGRRGEGRKGTCGQQQRAGAGTKAQTGNCVCQQCGYTENHQRGMPCVQKKCPQCGAFLTRQ